MNLKKICSLFLCLFLLSGCTKLPDTVSEMLVLKEQESVHKAKYRKKYYSYYAEPEVGRADANEISNVFNYQGTLFVMNLNIGSIVNSAYYKSSTSVAAELSDGITDKHAGTYDNLDGQTYTYTLYEYVLTNGMEYLVFDSPVVRFYGYMEPAKAPVIAGEMLSIARSVTVNQTAVLADYSSVETVTHEQTPLKLFKDIAPEEGKIQELFSDNQIGSDSSGDGND